MDALALARWQFAITTIFHFFFVPLTLGLSIFVALLETKYVRSGNVLYKKMAKFWGTIFLINFAIGVVTGIVQEFQFGLNWSEYSRFMGDIFGAPLAIEALLAFYLESTFIGVWVFGWDKVSKKQHLAAAWLVAIGSNISALWILIANSFMQHPVGYAIEGGRATMQDFFALLTNPNVWYQFPHVLSAGVSMAGFVVMGFSAWHLLRKHDVTIFRPSYQWAARYALVFVSLFTMHGANYLALKTEGEIEKRAKDVAFKSWVVATVLTVVFVAWTFVATDILTKPGVNGLIPAALAAVALLSVGYFSKTAKYGSAFIGGSLAVVFATIMVFAGLFPRILISTTNPGYSLTIYNASSTPYTLMVMTIVAVIFVPIVLAYQIWTYRVFRARVKADPQTLVY